MNPFAQTIGIAAGVIAFLSYIAYYVSILKGKTRPSRASWLIWTVVGFLILGSYYSVGARDTIWVPAAYALGPLITLVLSLRYGEKGWTRFDIFCLAGASASLLFWFLSRNALGTLLINIFIDFLGFLPTAKKSYLRPESEEAFPWVVNFISNILNVVAITAWSFDIAVYPIYILAANAIITYLLCFPHSLRRKAI